MTKRFKIYAATSDEESGNWVWLDTALPTRMTVKIKNARAKRSVYCQVRQIDSNFVRRYNREPSRVRIDPKGWSDVMVMGQWYRDALGGFPTTRGMPESEVELTVLPDPPLKSWLGWRQFFWPLRASSQHPDIAVRVGTCLGALGGWLGVISLVPVVIGFIGISNPQLSAKLFLGIAALAAVISIWACRGPRAPFPRVGVLAYGSLISEPGEVIGRHVLTTHPLLTPWPVEYCRRSSSRGGAPTLAIHPRGDRVNGAIFVLDVRSWNIGDVCAWVRAREGNPATSSIRLTAMDGMQDVIYVGLDANIGDCELTPQRLAEYAIGSVTRAGVRNGIRYLAANIDAGIMTPMTFAYRDAILELTGAPDLLHAERAVIESSS